MPLRKDFVSLIILFFIITAIVLGLKYMHIGDQYINYTVVLVANLLLFILTYISYIVHSRSLTTNNPYSFIRGVMMMMIIKLFVLGAALIIYLYAFKATKNIPGVLAGLLLYIIYSIFDVRAAIKLSKGQKKN